jgi:hypothetical protein
MSNTIFPHPIAWITIENEYNVNEKNQIHIKNIGRVGMEFFVDAKRVHLPVSLEYFFQTHVNNNKENK